MTEFELILIIMLTIGGTIVLLTLSSLSHAALRYVDAYERVVDAAVAPKPAVVQGAQLEDSDNTLEAGVYHATATDLKEYFKGRTQQNRTANERPQSWEYTDDEYDMGNVRRL